MKMQQVYRAVKCRERSHSQYKDVAIRITLKYTLYTGGDRGMELCRFEITVLINN